jgi:hypothetical protein
VKPAFAVSEDKVAAEATRSGITTTSRKAHTLENQPYVALRSAHFVGYNDWQRDRPHKHRHVEKSEARRGQSGLADRSIWLIFSPKWAFKPELKRFGNVMRSQEV